MQKKRGGGGVQIACKIVYVINGRSLNQKSTVGTFKTAVLTRNSFMVIPQCFFNVVKVT